MRREQLPQLGLPAPRAGSLTTRPGRLEWREKHPLGAALGAWGTTGTGILHNDGTPRLDFGDHVRPIPSLPANQGIPSPSCSTCLQGAGHHRRVRRLGRSVDLDRSTTLRLGSITRLDSPELVKASSTGQWFQLRLAARLPDAGWTRGEPTWTTVTTLASSTRCAPACQADAKLTTGLLHFAEAAQWRLDLEFAPASARGQPRRRHVDIATKP